MRNTVLNIYENMKKNDVHVENNIYENIDDKNLLNDESPKSCRYKTYLKGIAVIIAIILASVSISLGLGYAIWKGSTGPVAITTPIIYTASTSIEPVVTTTTIMPTTSTSTEPVVTTTTATVTTTTTTTTTSTMTTPSSMYLK